MTAIDPIFEYTPRAQSPASISPEITGPRRAPFPMVAFPRTCEPHNDPVHYASQPDPKRAGWLRVTCRRCGKFIGYRPTAIDGAGLLPTDQPQAKE